MKKIFNYIFAITLSSVTLMFLGNVTKSNYDSNYQTQEIVNYNEEVIDTAVAEQNVVGDVNAESITVTYTTSTNLVGGTDTVQYKVYNSTTSEFITPEWISINSTEVNNDYFIVDQTDFVGANSGAVLDFDNSYKFYFRVNGVDQDVKSNNVYLYTEPAKNEYLEITEVESINGQGSDDILVTYVLYKDLPSNAYIKFYVDSLEASGHDVVVTVTDTSISATSSLADVDVYKADATDDLTTQGTHQFHLDGLRKFDDYRITTEIFFNESGVINGYTQIEGTSRVFNTYGETVGYDNGGLSWWVWILLSLMLLTVLAFSWWGIDFYRKKKLIPQVDKEVIAHQPHIVEGKTTVEVTANELEHETKDKNNNYTWTQKDESSTENDKSKNNSSWLDSIKDIDNKDK